MDALAVVVLRRTGRVPAIPAATPPPDGPAWVRALEADLADRGWVLQHDLRVAASGLHASLRVRWADWLLAAVDDMVGADRPMLPLYRSFPNTPHDVDAIYVRRVLTHLFAVPDAPCVLCGREVGGAPLDPCGHVVCPACFPPEQFTACPICGRRIAPDNTYLPVVAPPASRRASVRDAASATPLPVRLVGHEVDPMGAARRLRDDLVTRATPLSEADRADLKVLVDATAPGRLHWLPEVVPARETLATVIAWALHAAALRPGYPEVVATARLRWSTATDAARTLWAYSGGDPGLVRPAPQDEPGWRPPGEPAVTVPTPRVRALPRPLRRAVLAHLDDCGAADAAEDLHRHATVWKRLGERLHPYEQAAAHPAAAVAFAALRGTRTERAGTLGAAIVAACAREPRHLRLTEHPDGRVSVRLRTHASLVEAALADGDAAGAARLLTERPGDLWRRLDHLLRTAGDDKSARGEVLAALRATAARVSTGVLASAAAQLAGRAGTVRTADADIAAVERARVAARAVAATRPAPVVTTGLMQMIRDAVRRHRVGPSASPPAGGQPQRVDALAEPANRVLLRVPRRVFFPRGDVATTWSEPERRVALPPTTVEPVRRLVDDELTRRARRLDRYAVAVLDADLVHVPAPVRERAGSDQLAGWPRGSLRTLPDADVLRLFLHWAQPTDVRVDLDLSCVFFDRDWARLGHCDFTALRYAGSAAVHSGDLTSAPAPLGATEFLDLHLQRLVERGARYAVPLVFSFNSVPFQALDEAFAGVMLPMRGGEQFDGARVLQRFDLRGNARMLLPLVVDLHARRLLWTDLTLPGRGYGHHVGRHGDQLALAAAAQWQHFLDGHRTTVFDLLAWHAAGRADRVLVAHRDGTWSDTGTDVDALRAAAGAPTGALRALPDLAGLRVLAGATDPDRLRRVAGAGPVRAGSTALTVTGTPDEPWTATSPAGLLALLTAS
ncbi:MXAN_6230/SCO0854 family RING domain-containing protein [Micromonospora sp. NPDC000729]|uniref:MXAN_6230/SCO0854 family RING domain-containing protein n=1 Tax=Micromonospora sp. NPDC000729 TaxID=3364220 RepID=UPI0036AFCD11